MPDPQRDIAPILELPPRTEQPWARTDAIGWAYNADWATYALALCATALLLALGRVLWRRLRPYQHLRQLPAHAHPKTAADTLARLYPQLRGTPDRLWLSDLERLRFAPPHADDAATLTRLCHAAAHFPRASVRHSR
jgi:hypothetical protein